MKTSRKDILDAANSCVNGERDAQYGSPENNFSKIAYLWNAYLDGTLAKSIQPHDVAAMLALLKIARISSGQAKDDNWIDLAGYAACGGEIQSGYKDIIREMPQHEDKQNRCDTCGIPKSPVFCEDFCKDFCPVYPDKQ